MEIKAKAKFIRMSPRKIRLAADLVRGLDVVRAEDQLKFLAKAAREPVASLLASCVANAVNNFKLKKENLYIKTITVDGGPALKRWQPKAFGRATPIKKRSSHISLILAERLESAKKTEEVRATAGEPPKPKLVESLNVFRKQKAVEGDKVDDKKQDKGERGDKGPKQNKGFLKRFFNRRTG